jgi:hypothetical protein
MPFNSSRKTISSIVATHLRVATRKLLPLVITKLLEQLERLVTSMESDQSDFVSRGINSLRLVRSLDPLTLDGGNGFSIVQNIEFRLGIIGREFVRPWLELGASNRPAIAEVKRLLEGLGPSRHGQCQDCQNNEGTLLKTHIYLPLNKLG